MSGPDGSHGDSVPGLYPEEHLPGAAGLRAANAPGPPPESHQEQEGIAPEHSGVCTRNQR